MPRKCCVPGCRSNYAKSGCYVNVFSFPKTEQIRAKWLAHIHRKDFVVGKESVVCINHFDEKFIIRQHRATRPDGTELIMSRTHPILTEDAYPTIFLEQPRYLSSSIPAKRKDPNERFLACEERAEEEFVQYLDNDKIKSFEDFTKNIVLRLSFPWIVFFTKNAAFVVKYDSLCFPKFPISIKVQSDLSASVWENGNIISPSTLKWLFGSEQKCLNWSTFDSMISFLNSFNSTFDDKLNAVILLLNDYIDTCPDSIKCEKIKFISEQLHLCKGVPRYSSELMIWAATFFYSYPTAYVKIRNSKKLTLPHINYLKRLLQKVGTLKCGLPQSQIQYLKEKNRQLSDREKIVGVMIDEIYVKSEISYKGGKVEGFAENANESARTLQAFMISSVFSKNKDIVALFPVRDQNAEDLQKLLLVVLKGLQESNYKVLYVVADNNAVNTKLYVLLGNGQLITSVPSPVGGDMPIYLLFDTVHLLKNIRNNWLNQKDNNQTFFIPPFKNLFKNDGDIPDHLVASVSHLKDVYYKEKHSVVKLATSLTRKSLWPSSLERQNVRHTLCLFNDKLIPALDLAKSKFGNHVQGTAHFITVILKWWKIINTQAPYKGEHLRDSSCIPIKSTNDENFKFLKEFCTWLTDWESLCVSGMSEKSRRFRLSRETHQALLHTNLTLIGLCKYLLEILNPPAAYILLGKFQTDCLEARFGQYRGMSGCNYTVSVVQILESERKLKLLSLLKLKSSRKGNFEIKDILNSCSQKVDDDSFWNFDSFFLVLEASEAVVVNENNEKALIFIAGYVARVAIGKCSSCKSKMTLENPLDCEINEKMQSYLGVLDRGGLFWPNDTCIHICVSTFKLFQTLISSRFEEEFLSVENQKKLLIELVLEKLQVEEDIGGNVECSNESCKKTMDKLLYLCAKSLSNIFLNNYCKKCTNNIASSKMSKKRKVATLTK